MADEKLRVLDGWGDNPSDVVLVAERLNGADFASYDYWY